MRVGTRPEASRQRVVDSQLRRIPGGVAISAKTGAGLDQMIQELEN